MRLQELKDKVEQVYQAVVDHTNFGASGGTVKDLEQRTADKDRRYRKAAEAVGIHDGDQVHHHALKLIAGMDLEKPAEGPGFAAVKKFAAQLLQKLKKNKFDPQEIAAQQEEIKFLNNLKDIK